MNASNDERNTHITHTNKQHTMRETHTHHTYKQWHKNQKSQSHIHTNQSHRHNDKTIKTHDQCIDHVFWLFCHCVCVIDLYVCVIVIFDFYVIVCMCDVCVFLSSCVVCLYVWCVCFSHHLMHSSCDLIVMSLLYLQGGLVSFEAPGEERYSLYCHVILNIYMSHLSLHTHITHTHT